MLPSALYHCQTTIMEVLENRRNSCAFLFDFAHSGGTIYVNINLNITILVLFWIKKKKNENNDNLQISVTKSTYPGVAGLYQHVSTLLDLLGFCAPSSRICSYQLFFHCTSVLQRNDG